MENPVAAPFIRETGPIIPTLPIEGTVNGRLDRDFSAPIGMQQMKLGRKMCSRPQVFTQPNLQKRRGIYSDFVEGFGSTKVRDQSRGHFLARIKTGRNGADVVG